MAQSGSRLYLCIEMGGVGAKMELLRPDPEDHVAPNGGMGMDGDVDASEVVVGLLGVVAMRADTCRYKRDIHGIPRIIYRLLLSG